MLATNADQITEIPHAYETAAVVDAAERQRDPPSHQPEQAPKVRFDSWTVDERGAENHHLQTRAGCHLQKGALSLE